MRIEGDATTSPIRLALVGIGKIARDQHIPAIEADRNFEFVAGVSHGGDGIKGLPYFYDIDALVESDVEVDAVSVATPPQGRHAITSTALKAGLHVMLEKPPGTTVSEVAQLAASAQAAGLTLFTTWHSREAACVDAARGWLAGKILHFATVRWKEDIRVWHPGQEWILEPGGLGVFDPGINALSIATAVFPEALRLESARLHLPTNRQAPIAAQLSLQSAGTPIEAEFDFLHTGPQSWDIVVETDRGCLRLSDGGQRMTVDGQETLTGTNEEYPRLYRRFAELVREARSDVDLTPFQIVADAFLLGERVDAPAFEF